MSRYSLKPYPHRTDVFEVAVGWDAHFVTYFAIVFAGPESAGELGSGLIDQSQNMTVAARAMAEKKAVGHRS
jgi:hypothetical protein